MKKKIVVLNNLNYKNNYEFNYNKLKMKLFRIN